MCKEKKRVLLKTLFWLIVSFGCFNGVVSFFAVGSIGDNKAFELDVKEIRNIKSYTVVYDDLYIEYDWGCRYEYGQWSRDWIKVNDIPNAHKARMIAEQYFTNIRQANWETFKDGKRVPVNVCQITWFDDWDLNPFEYIGESLRIAQVTIWLTREDGSGVGLRNYLYVYKYLENHKKWHLIDVKEHKPTKRVLFWYI